MRWVYRVAGELLPLSSGVYGADLGPDPRNAALAARAFGPNLVRLAYLKHRLDPRNVLAHACPVPKYRAPELIFLVTGETGAGKDFCAGIWAFILARRSHAVRTVSISKVTKREYAAATGADLDRLLYDRTYKEQHRPALTAFFRDQVQQQHGLLEDHFLRTVYHGAKDAPVLLITGMRDKAPVAALSHLVPESRLLEVRIEASKEARLVRRGGCEISGNDNNDSSTPLPSFTFDNTAAGNSAARTFTESYLLPFLKPCFGQLAAMARPVSDFPRPGIDFRHILGIS